MLQAATFIGHPCGLLTSVIVFQFAGPLRLHSLPLLLGVVVEVDDDVSDVEDDAPLVASAP